MTAATKRKTGRARKRGPLRHEGRVVEARTSVALESFDFDELVLDHRNPRLPEDMQAGTQDELLQYIASEYEPIEIAKSIAQHGYFPSEPIIVVREAGRNVVVEGNRRLVAMLLLSNPDRAAELNLPDADEWETIQPAIPIPTAVPAVVAGSREDVAPILGFRHISGIEPWDPWAQARFLAAFIDDERKSFAEAAALVGEPERAVRESYRNYRAARQFKKLGVKPTRVIQRFGVFTRAMQDSDIRAFLGAPAAQGVKPRRNPLPKGGKSKRKVKEVVSWLFGTDDEEPLFTDSRKIAEFGTVLASKDGLAELRKTRDLEAAFAISGGIKARLLSKLNRAATSLAQATIDIGGYRDDEDVEAAIAECAERLRELQDGDDG